MIVEIVNITDVPGSKHAPTQVDIYNKTIDPGATLRLPADLIDRKVRALEERGFIAIGQVPPWYAAAKMRKGRTLSQEEMQSRTRPPAPVPAPVPVPAPKIVKKLELAEDGPVPPEDEFTIDRKRQKR